MNKLYRFLLKYICKRIVVQGYSHKANITEYYGIMYKAARNEFTEDGDVSLKAFLQECYDSSK